MYSFMYDLPAWRTKHFSLYLGTYDNNKKVTAELVQNLEIFLRRE